MRDKTLSVGGINPKVRANSVDHLFKQFGQMIAIRVCKGTEQIVQRPLPFRPRFRECFPSLVGQVDMGAASVFFALPTLHQSATFQFVDKLAERCGTDAHLIADILLAGAVHRSQQPEETVLTGMQGVPPYVMMGAMEQERGLMQQSENFALG